MRALLGLAAATVAIGAAAAHGEKDKELDVEAIEIQRYDIHLAAYPKETYSQTYGGSIEVACTLAVRNGGEEEIEEVPLCLHRLLEVQAAHTGAGEAITFRQEFGTHPHFGARYQAKRVTLVLPQPLEGGEELEVALQYGGPVCAYTEALAYVWDHVSPEFTLLRTEVGWFPIVSPAPSSPAGR